VPNVSDEAVTSEPIFISQGHQKPKKHKSRLVYLFTFGLQITRPYMVQ